jgi:hypothetical protein
VDAQGAHLLLQIRTRTLNGDLASTFCNRYPNLSVADQPAHQHFSLHDRKPVRFVGWLELMAIIEPARASAMAGPAPERDAHQET